MEIDMIIDWLANRKFFNRIILAVNGVRLGWLRFRENSVACDINDSLMPGRKQRLREKHGRLKAQLMYYEDFGEFLRRQIAGETKKPDIRRVA